MISSVQHPKVKQWAKLQHKKERDHSGTFLVVGDHLIEEAKRANALIEVLVCEAHPEYPHAHVLSPHVMKKIIGTEVPIAGVAKKNHPQSKRYRGLVLDRVQDPGNVGTLLRSASAFGFDWVMLYQSADIYSLKVVSSSQGALWQCECEILESLDDVDRYRNSHVWVATTLDGSPGLPPQEKPLLLLLGNEGAGLDPSLIEKADYRLTITTQTVESLNVAVAGSILMHQLKN